MKLLIITQKVDINDDNLGFFHRWLEKLAGKVTKLSVVCLAEGEHHLSSNVAVYSLGKERGYSKIRQFFLLQKFLLKDLPEADGVFIHMCPIYAVASWPLVKIFRKKMILWFVHRDVNWKLKLAEKCVAKILTASEESCRLKNRKKIAIVGHGIDTEFFKPLSSDAKHQTSGAFRILSAGRISPIKNLQTLIEAMNILIHKKDFKDVEVRIVGSSLGKDEEKHKQTLEEISKRYELIPTEEKNFRGCIIFEKGKPHRKMPELYNNANLFVNLSQTGSIDKAVLEAMACSVPVLTSNEAFLNILPAKYLFKNKNPQDLAEKIISLINASKDDSLREIVVKNYNLNDLTDKIISEFNGKR